MAECRMNNKQTAGIPVLTQRGFNSFGYSPAGINCPGAGRIKIQHIDVVNFTH